MYKSVTGGFRRYVCLGENAQEIGFWTKTPPIFLNSES